MRILRWIAFALGALILLGIGVAAAARFADGPIGPFPGGPFTSGDLVTSPDVDWTAFAERSTVELQLVEPERSRTTWLLVRDGIAYVPCGYPNAGVLKQWPHEVLRDGRVVVRIDGKRYERQAVQVSDPAEWQALLALSNAKYGRADLTPETLWYFRLEPRTPVP